MAIRLQTYFEVSSRLFWAHQAFFEGLNIPFADRPGTTAVATIAEAVDAQAIRDHSGYWVVDIVGAVPTFVPGSCRGC